MTKSALLGYSVVALLVALSGCSGPRSMVWDGTVMERGQVGLAASQVVSLPGASLGAYLDVLSHGRDSLIGLTQVERREVERATLASMLDMPGVATDLSAHVGIGWGVDLGLRYVAGNKGGDVRWQFLDGGRDDWNGGVGLGYTWNSVEAPTKAGEALGTTFKRSDLLLPVSFGKCHGSPGSFNGSSAIGLGMAWSHIEYGFAPEPYTDELGNVVREAVPMHTQDYYSLGVQYSGRYGWKQVALLLGTSIWHTDYGSYVLPGSDRPDLSLEGWTFVPSVGLDIRF